MKKIFLYPVLMISVFWVVKPLAQTPKLSNAFYFSSGIVVDSKGNAFVTGKNSRIIKISPQGKAELFAGGGNKKDGIGKVVDLGGVADSAKNIEPYGPYVPNLNIGVNGKLYYIVGGHGNFLIENKTVLMEFDPTTKKHTLIYQFPVEELSEATGSDTKDKDGNLYFAGRKDLPSRSVPFLIKFNPGKNVKK